jgi:hypothetical protein
MRGHLKLFTLRMSPVGNKQVESMGFEEARSGVHPNLESAAEHITPTPLALSAR